MSRCFPFPPSGHIVRNGARSEALIESIKLPTEMDKARKDIKKEKKRENEEKRKEKKERKRKGAASHASADSKKFKRIDDKKGIRPDGKLQKVEHYENVQLERSGITEELCCLSDSSQSSKRKRSSSLSNDEHGTDIRNRIPLKKHRKTEESKIEHQVGSSCGTSGIADSFTQATGRRDHQLPCVASEEPNKFVGISESRHGKPLQPLVHGDNLGTNNVVDDKRRFTQATGRRDHQLPCVASEEPNKFVGISKSRHGKPLQPLVHGDNLGTNNVVDDKRRFTQATGRRDHQLPCVASEEPNKFVGISESRHGKPLQPLVHGDNLGTNNVVDDKRRFTQATGRRDHQLPCVASEEPNKFVGISKSRHGKPLQPLVHGDNLGTNNVVDDKRRFTQATGRRDHQLPCVASEEPNKFVGISESRHGKPLQPLVHGDNLGTNNVVDDKRRFTQATGRRDHQLPRVASEEPNKFVGISESRHGKPLQPLVHGDNLGTNNVVDDKRRFTQATGRRDHQLPCVASEEPNKFVGISESRHGKPLQPLVHGDNLGTNNVVDDKRRFTQATGRRDHQLPCVASEEPNKFVGISESRHGKPLQPLVHGDNLGTNNVVDDKRRFTQATGRRDHQLPCVASEEPNKFVGISKSRHGKPLQPLVHGDNLGTNNVVDDKRRFTQATGRRDHQLPCVASEEPNKFVGISKSRHGKPLQPLVHGDTLGTNNVVDDKRRRMASLYDSLFPTQIPPLTGDVFESDDQDWLFGSVRTEARPSSSIKAKKSATATDAFHCSSQQCLWPPRAQYLAEAEIYALPYTVPF